MKEAESVDVGSFFKSVGDNSHSILHEKYSRMCQSEDRCGEKAPVDLPLGVMSDVTTSSKSVQPTHYNLLSEYFIHGFRNLNIHFEREKINEVSEL